MLLNETLVPRREEVKPMLNHFGFRRLRSSRGDLSDLEESFVHVRYELALQSTIGFRVIIEGRPRRLKPMLRDEIFLIGREAIVNAYRHSRATSIETEIEYARDRLRIVVRDDGCGIDPDVLRSDCNRHLGLQGMRERAERISGRIRVFSRVKAGTEVELGVPGRIAFLEIRE